MLEDCTVMEKKPSNRPQQTPTKGLGSDVKKSQDAANGVLKQFPRQSRRSREPLGSKSDQNRKSYPQQKQQSRSQYNSSYDYCNKRPKSRGQSYYSCGKANSQVVDELVEQFGLVVNNSNGGGTGAVTSLSSYGADDVGGEVMPFRGKKQNLNHLLNFHFEPRGDNRMHTHRSGGTNASGGLNSGSRSWLSSTHKHKYNKEQFLQANCQFIVRSDGDYSSCLVDPDILVDWDMIEQVRVFSCDEVNCPICLCTPVAGKITRCGHVFCWPCMLHYLALSDKSWRKCPICYEAVHRQDLKSVAILLRTAYTVKDQVTFQLMKRKRGTLVSSPVTQYDARCKVGFDSILMVAENNFDTIYSKLLTANTDQVLDIINKEKSELDKELLDNKDCPEACFVEQAIELLLDRKNILGERQKSTVHQMQQEPQSKNVNDEGSMSSSVFVSKNINPIDNCNVTTIHEIVNNEDNDENTNNNRHESKLMVNEVKNAHSKSENHKVDEEFLLSPDIQFEHQCNESSNIFSFDNNETDYGCRGSTVTDEDGYYADNGDGNDNRTDEFFEQYRSTNETTATGITPSQGGRWRYTSVSSEEYSISNDEITGVTFEDLDISSPLQSSIPVEMKQKQCAAFNINEGTTASGDTAAVNPGYGCETSAPLPSSFSTVSTASSAPNSSKDFYFYQAIDGQQLFLHAVNIRMLEMSYGSLEHCPTLISGCILEKEAGSMTEELRKRLRYLQHMPLTCQFEVAEIELKPPSITKDTWEFFKEQLEIRKKRRDRRAREERRREKRVGERVDRQFHCRGPTPKLRIESLQHFPECGSEISSSPDVNGCIPRKNTHEEVDNSSCMIDRRASKSYERSGSPTNASSRASSPSSIRSTSPNASANSSMSFARMLREGKSANSTSVWPTTGRSSYERMLQPSKPQVVQYDSDGECISTAPQYRHSFSDAIAMAFEQQSTQLHNKDLHPNCSKVSSGRKKKKKQKVLLFATGMAYNSKG